MSEVIEKTDCTNCANAVFDELWGEYKCLVEGHTVYRVDLRVNCPTHVSGEPQISKEEREKYEC